MLTAKRNRVIEAMPEMSRMESSYMRGAVQFVRSQYIKGREAALFDDAASHDAENIKKFMPRICRYLGIDMRIKSYGSCLVEVVFK